MTFTDSHTHLYLDAFDQDRSEMIRRALGAGVKRMLLPNIDDASVGPMLDTCRSFPENCFPMIGLHPTSVKGDFRQKLELIESHLNHKAFVGIGETGIDLYWDKSHLEEQILSLELHIEWAKNKGLPIVIHARESFGEIFRVLDRVGTTNLKGVFHSFTGNQSELEKALSYGFYIGINGIVTFKNSGLADLVKSIPAERLLLETDAPFLAPVPYRGKRNESAYLLDTADKVAEIHNLSLEECGVLTHNNATRLFNLDILNGTS